MRSQAERMDRLYKLLPALLQVRDVQRGEPLRALLQVIAEQVNVVEDDIERLYENWFIETCEDWVVPYIGDLVGEVPVHEAGEPGDVTTEQGRARNRILTPRREVANAIRNRRRKGTLALLELLARDVSGWPARVIEFRRWIAQTSSLRSRTPPRGRLLDVRSAARLGQIGTAFESLSRGSDVRRLNSVHQPGRFNAPAVGLFVWRLRAYSITHAPASCIENVGANCFTFSALGNDVPLFNRPIAQTDDNAIAGQLNVPDRISRQELSREVKIGDQTEWRVSTDYYGLVDEAGSRVAQSIAIWAQGWAGRPDHEAEPLPADLLIPADLSGWRYAPKNGQVAVDPVLGRIMFPPRQFPKRGVSVSYHYGFSADIGGGEYTRPLRQDKEAKIIPVRGKEELERELAPWRSSGGAAHEGEQPKHAVIEIADSGVYVMPMNLTLEPEHTLQIRAAQHTRPVFRLLDWHTNLPDNFSITGGAGSRFILDGIMVAGRGLQVEGELATLMVRHSTLVPGWSLEPNCDPQRPAEPSIEIIDSRPCVVIEHSIVGSIQVNDDQVRRDPLTLRVSDSIVDATGTDCDGPECEAIGASGSRLAHATLTIQRSTVIGRVMTHAIELAENSIFVSTVTVAKRQSGCMRFCYVPSKSRTPKRFHCQPDEVVRAVETQMRREGAPEDDIEQAIDAERRRVRPVFNSLRYGTPTYCQLADACAPEITRGADDESEMGVFHDLFQPQRLANLRARLDEYAPASTDTGILFET